MHRSEEKRPLIVASLTSMSDLDALSERLLARVDWLEVRADLMEIADPAGWGNTAGRRNTAKSVSTGGWVNPTELRRRFAGPLLFTLRSVAEGGRSTHSASERRTILEAAAAQYDFVDVELVADGDSGSLDCVPQSKRVISWHGRFGAPASLEGLEILSKRQQAFGAAHYKLIAAAETPEEALPSLLLQAQWSGVGGSQLTSFAMGECGAWSRLIAASHGCALLYGACSSTPAAAGQLSVGKLIDDYSLGGLEGDSGKAVAGKPLLCGIFGAPVSHSLSPRIHNGAYRDAGINGLFVPIATQDPRRTLQMFTSEEFATLGFQLKGFAVTTPHKDAALSLGEATSRARTIGAANTLIAPAKGDGPSGRMAEGMAGWTADSTDPQGVVGPLLQRGVALSGLRAAVVGAGGAGRAAVYGLQRAGCQVTLANRSVVPGEQAAAQLEVEFVPLVNFDVSKFGVVVNATSLGHRLDDSLPFSVELVGDKTTLVDMVYRGSDAPETALIEQARRRGIEAVDGREVLLHQAIEQFRLLNGAELDVERAALRLSGGSSA